MRLLSLSMAAVFSLGCLASNMVYAAPIECPSATPAQSPPIIPLPGFSANTPVFPDSNWWNQDISGAPVAPQSATYYIHDAKADNPITAAKIPKGMISGIGGEALHPDFGNYGADTYGIPYAVVDSSQPKKAVNFFYYPDESDGVNALFYPIPDLAITERNWIEEGSPGTVNITGLPLDANYDPTTPYNDRHLLILDCTHNDLYELYNVYYGQVNTLNPNLPVAPPQWQAGSGAFFDMDVNGTRPAGWTSADAAGLAIFPGLVRYDEVMSDTITEIKHAYRFTLGNSRSYNNSNTTGYVFPASHQSGPTSQDAPPFGAIMRLKNDSATQAKLNSALNLALNSTQNPDSSRIRKIFTAMQKYGLIFADHGTDIYVSGTLDPRWGSDNASMSVALKTAFEQLHASDFEFVQLGWQSGAATPLSITDISATSPSTVVGGQSSSATVTLSAPAPAGGAVVKLVSGVPQVGTPAVGTPGSPGYIAASSNYKPANAANLAIHVPDFVTVAEGATTATVPITTSAVTNTTIGVLTATYDFVSRTTVLTVNPTLIDTLSASPSIVMAGQSSNVTITLNSPAPAGGAVVSLSSNFSAIQVPAPGSVTIAAGATSVIVPITTSAVANSTVGTLTASYNDASKTTTLTVNPATLPAISTLTANPSTVAGGSPSVGTLTLSAAAPTGGAVVALTSSTSAIQVPASVTVAAGQLSVDFSIATSTVASSTAGTLTASYNSASKTATLTVNPPPPAALSAVALDATTIVGGGSLNGRVTLAAPASSNTTVTLRSSNSTIVPVPASVTVTAGANPPSASFTVSTSAVSSSRVVTITATYNGVSKTTTLTVNPPPALNTLALSPSTIAGGGSVTGTIRLTAPAPAGGATVTLSSSNNTIARVPPSSLVIPQGSQEGTFTITTTRPSRNTNVTISARYLTITRSAGLTVTRN
jgi:hypothetical protein